MVTLKMKTMIEEKVAHSDGQHLFQRGRREDRWPEEEWYYLASNVNTLLLKYLLNAHEIMKNVLSQIRWKKQAAGISGTRK